MISVNITTTGEAREFVIQLSQEITNRKGLNDALGRALARHLQTHFREKNAEPNKMGAAKTNFWAKVAEATALTEVTDEGATVSVADHKFRLHLLGGVIKPTGGRKFLTIPLIAEAREKRAASYEQETGRKLFRLPGVKLLFERSGSGTQSTIGSESASVRRRDGSFRKVNLSARSRIRPVYALASQVTIPKDAEALPPANYLIDQLTKTSVSWLKRNIPT